ncbi:MULTISPECIES: Na/Pi cotransporter family protein [Alphaproteobacteria]|uniref:Na+/cotransporter n=2 Tax=Alphaproteobacteria TaxID=28211 RepID=A0A512HD00_9HYPH|nr:MULTISPECIES: Na/Pi cotransporter family protein [Alphaproteobacteria]GEO83329.1 Na+/cotransporter [Ciceribacter naphthalenivorans]GLR20277.1 Na+/cotransporter [Ciceribacter naphthalenivorans]GLT03133.1 Na+/cotransporter [Sphingomonas psychrolutea]
MSGIVVFINLAGAVALLLWATRMVRTGIERAYGNVLKDRLRLALGNRFSAAVAGFFFAIALQSATAVALIISSFVAGGYVSAGIGVATLLGADVGSAFVVRILRYDLSLLIPILLLMGTIAFRASEERNWRQAGRILFGLGLLLLSLRLIGEASDPLRSSEILPLVLNYLSRDWITAFLLAALLAWAFHSSVATILLFASLADRHLLPPALIIPLVLGANFGAAVIGAILTKNAEPGARIVPLGNVVIRGLATLIALALQFAVQLDPLLLAGPPGDAVVMVHLAINAAVLFFGLPFSGLVARLLAGLFAKPSPDTAAPVRLSVLNPADLANPRQAISNATREVLTVCEKTEVMLNWIFDLYETWDPKKMERIAALDDEIDAIHRDIKFYLARISESALDEVSAAQCQNLLGTTIKIEQAADIISQNMATRVRKKHDRNTAFSPEGWAELTTMHNEVARNARLAFNLLVNRDVEHARQLVARKEAVRNLVRTSEEQHMQRLRNGNVASLESSSLHIDTMRDLKEINSLFVSIGYPLLETEGMLRRSRLL